ncbi:MAG: methylenetetrahydrofolate reductase [NAD(P)H] [Dehalococcoidia bacterium]|nr:methylenetetrahydrofolate reductase [NAD(P)H] [Dehalococcoidia bacterium]
MKIDQLLKERGSSLSFEFFSPKDERGEETLFSTIQMLVHYSPSFVSVTYGAGGGTSKNTTYVVERIIQETSLNTMPHITCINQSRESLEAILYGYKALGVDNIMALRGDPPLDQDGHPIMPKSRYYARDLVRLIRPLGGYSIGVAVYPEGHMDTPNLEEDILLTKEKIDAGADFGITQMFFDNNFFYAFMERARRVGVNIPIIAAIMPIGDIARMRAFCQRCGASLPDAYVKRFGDNASKADALEIGIELACKQVEDLMHNGIRNFHFYTLNRGEAVARIIENLGLQKLGITQ